MKVNHNINMPVCFMVKTYFEAESLILSPDDSEPEGLVALPCEDEIMNLFHHSSAFVQLISDYFPVLLLLLPLRRPTVN